MTEPNEEIRLATLRGRADERERIIKLLQDPRADERERIIKLLEDPATMSNWSAMPDKSLGLYGNLKNYIIALIKGEK